MTTMTDTNWIELAGAPAIPGLRVRRWRDAADYASMAAVAAAAYDADAVPFMPTADNLQVQIEGEDGIDPASDLALVEVDGALVAYGEVWGVTRDGRPMFEVAGIVHPAYRRRGIGRALLAENLRRARERAATEPADAPILVEGFVEDTRDRASGDPDRGRLRARSAFLPDAGPRPRPHPRRAAPGRPRAAAGHPGPASGDLRCRGRRVQGPLGPPRPGRRPVPDDVCQGRARHVVVGGRLGRRRDRRRRAGVDLARGERALGREARLDGAHQRPPSVAAPRSRPGAHRGVPAPAACGGHDDAMLGVDSENPTGALGLYEGLGFIVHSRAAAYRRELER